MQAITPPNRHAQRGLSLTGLIFVLAVFGALGVFGMRVLPTFSEFRSVKNAIAAAKSGGGTLREMQTAFDKNARVNDIEAVKGKDLVISKDGEETDISFSYEKRIPIAGNVSLLIDYSGTTAKNGVVAQKPDDAAH
jgi:type II secretory pathway pseudopilin PulG